MKYVKVQHPAEAMPKIIFTVAPASHAEIAEGFIARGFTVISAGFYDPAARVVFGMSESLRIESDPRDLIPIEAMIRATLSTAPGKTAAKMPAPASSPVIRRFSALDPIGSQPEVAIRHRPTKLPAGLGESVLREIAGLE